MNKAELLESIATKTSASKADCARFLDAFIECVTENIGSADGVKLPGFGAFTKSERKARSGRNPHTGETIQIPASTAPVFKAGAQLKAALGKPQAGTL